MSAFKIKHACLQPVCNHLHHRKIDNTRVRSNEVFAFCGLSLCSPERDSDRQLAQNPYCQWLGRLPLRRDHMTTRFSRVAVILFLLLRQIYVCLSYEFVRTLGPIALWLIARGCKRHVADLSITDKASRSHAANERHIALLQLLQTADTATGGKCGCLFVKRTGHRHKCHCDFTSLLSTLINSLRSSESGTGKELDRVVRSMDDSQRSVFLKLVLKELHKARRMRALGRNRLMRLRRRVLLRKRFLSKYPRAAFDGKQMISF
ncbi:unnamed protein product [Clavelina lepadiformis]|uniref:Uncharacterized protein n=1 Tax=Clavelina lepadiformis TaxID=159417 RepID=A0ABP0EUU6_CLALP